MKRNKKKLATVLAIFSLILAIGIVYAAVAGTLTFNGTVNLDDFVKLDIVNASVNDAGSSINVSPDKQSATLVANPAAPGDAVTFSFKVQNVGNADAVIDSVVLTDVNGALVGDVTISGDYDLLENEIVQIGDTTGSYTIIVTWDSAAVSAAGTDTFKVTMDYSKAA